MLEPFSVGGDCVDQKKFIEDLQDVGTALSPYEISQRVRIKIGCVSICSWDSKLDTKLLRGYMKRGTPKTDRSPEDPELFDCVVSTNQSQAWQYVVWIKEILQIFDHVDERTNTKQAFLDALRMRNTEVQSSSNELPSVQADRNGFVLALGSSVPFRYRKVLRAQRFFDRYCPQDLEKLLFVPMEKIEFLLGDTFEEAFKDALETGC